MNYRLMLLGSTATRAPENDEGADFDDSAGTGAEFEDEGDGEDEFDPDDPDDQDDEPGDDGDDEPPPRQQSRAQTRIQRLDTEKKAEKERADRLQADLDALRRQPTGTQKTQEQLAAERTAKLASMTEAQRLEYLITENSQATQHQINEIRFATWDAGDKASFSGMCAANPALKAIEGEVEKRLTELRATGQNAARDAVAKFILGEKALNKATRSKNAGRKREQEGRDQHVARPSNGRGDVAPQGQRRTSEREARRKRLEGMSI